MVESPLNQTGTSAFSLTLSPNLGTNILCWFDTFTNHLPRVRISPNILKNAYQNLQLKYQSFYYYTFKITTNEFH